MLHIFPLDDTSKHSLDGTCQCGAIVVNSIVVVHAPFDGREGIIFANEILNNKELFKT